MTKEKVFISEADQYLFAQGTHYDIYKKLGAHLSTEDGVQGVYFGVWAPNAAQVNVIGTFNEWNEESHPMQKLGEGGIWGLFVPGVEEGTMYKFLIYARDGRKLYKADPFANYAEYGEKPDGIPDKYQKKITFKVVNGTWEDKSANDISYYVTLLDKEGKWNVNGTARINIPTSPVMRRWCSMPTPTFPMAAPSSR